MAILRHGQHRPLLAGSHQSWCSIIITCKPFIAHCLHSQSRLWFDMCYRDQENLVTSEQREMSTKEMPAVRQCYWTATNGEHHKGHQNMAPLGSIEGEICSVSTEEEWEAVDNWRHLASNGMCQCGLLSGRVQWSTYISCLLTKIFGANVTVSGWQNEAEVEEFKKKHREDMILFREQL